MIREAAPWLGLWFFAFYLTAVAYVWNAQGQYLLAALAGVAVLGCMGSLIAKSVTGER